MNKYKKSLLLLSLFSLFSLVTLAQVDLVKDNKAVSRIVVDQTKEGDRQAALLLQDFVQRISSVKLPIVEPKISIRKGDVLIGSFQLPIRDFDNTQIGKDGFYITTQNNTLRIVDTEGKGLVYGVVSLLEDYLGVRYYAADAYTLTKSNNISIPTIEGRLENPSFAYRQTQAYSLSDPIYKLWHRLESPNEVFAANYWVHTFDPLLPSKKYGQSHPEYYALINGERRPGWASQWCLTNPDVFDIVANRVDSIFKVNPDKRIISISQNDGHDTYCTCPKCDEVNQREGSQSGTIIEFVNKLATKFPDKEFSTLAYMYSVAPPMNIKPLPNVNIMLCNIECSREVPLAENELGQQFIRNMEGWAKISDNIFVWDYGIDFDSYLSPFPNLHVLKPNMQQFKKNKTTMHFSQIAGSKGGDMSELRSYLAAKLMWNVDADADLIIKEFLDGYYGKEAAPYLYDYLKLREGALMGSNIPLRLYDTPVSHKNGMLNKSMQQRYIELFDKAEEASKGNKRCYDRVKECRLVIQYSELETAHTYVIDNPKTLADKLDFFRNRAQDLNVSILDEQGKIINDYCDSYKARYLTARDNNLAKDAKVNFLIPPHDPYNINYDTSLTDGILGAMAPSGEWIGWQNQDGEFVLDLGASKQIQGIEIDFLQRLGSWVLLPKSVTWYVSDDNKKFKEVKQQDIPEDRDTRTKFVSISSSAPQSVQARYIKLKIETIGLCSSWHLAVGHPAWFLIDEVFVY